MNLFSPLLALKAARQLGFTPVALNALYRLGLVSGHYRRAIQPPDVSYQPTSMRRLFTYASSEALLAALGTDGLQALRQQADEIAAGQYRQFGGEPVEINLTPPRPLAHWSDYENGRIHLAAPDIKFIWEPARFGWAFTLGRAYRLTGDERYAQTFWHWFETFAASNPPYLGPNWMSGQEVGMRLMAFVWASQAFSHSEHSTRSRLAALAVSTAVHAARIPATLLYARSQNNNHLLIESAALYTASLALPNHPLAVHWRELGQTWLTWCFTHQIDACGEYVQHSTNYHRLMLQTALWLAAIESNAPGKNDDLFSPAAKENLALAAHWLLSLLDPNTGRVPNLGANDGAVIFPLATQPFADYRPTAQAAARAFLGYTLPSGPWDEYALWLGMPRAENRLEIPRYPGDSLYAKNSWGYLRAVRYKSRPSHADQLHFDLWWRGLNIAQDAGTYFYNAAPPWDNSLTSTLVHNTVSINGLEQMTRAGRFLYLDWADATIQRHIGGDDASLSRAIAQTHAYARLGVRHTRTVAVSIDETWRVEDELLNLSQQAHTFRLHWLLPDWEWQLEETEQGAGLRFVSPQGIIRLNISLQPANAHPSISLVRAGERLYGAGKVEAVRGWVSPTYSLKIPALSLAVAVESAQNVAFASEFIFPTP